MLADWEAEDAGFGGEREAVDSCVVRDFALLGEWEFLVGCWVEDLALLWYSLSV